jgi:hypothetical protein
MLLLADQHESHLAEPACGLMSEHLDAQAQPVSLVQPERRPLRLHSFCSTCKPSLTFDQAAHKVLG